MAVNDTHDGKEDREPQASAEAEPTAEPTVLEDAPRLFGGLRAKSRIRAGLTVKQKVTE